MFPSRCKPHIRGWGERPKEAARQMGLVIELTLQGIGEELKCRTHLDEPYVAKKAILLAVRRQNEVILALQTRMLDMAKIEAGLQLTMNNLQKGVGASKYRSCRKVVIPIVV